MQFSIPRTSCAHAQHTAAIADVARMSTDDARVQDDRQRDESAENGYGREENGRSENLKGGEESGTNGEEQDDTYTMLALATSPPSLTTLSANLQNIQASAYAPSKPLQQGDDDKMTEEGAGGVAFEESHVRYRHPLKHRPAQRNQPKESPNCVQSYYFAEMFVRMAEPDEQRLLSPECGIHHD
ncbi:hypothetical protein EV702DRAFT_1041023 [Suillus placidus]|uniref:Uncharacterized protein n=1 Tax=Suillus placidus TaxID=48579 RepID=A0A9P7A6C9_9AGAM|nr:hypothetical protein EV702DRAFT_1041023 [Suillus placidus]